MEAWIVEYTLREIGGYAYETDEDAVLFASEKDAKQFFDDLPQYVEKKLVGYVLENRRPPRKVGGICKYDHDNLKISVIEEA